MITPKALIWKRNFEKEYEKEKRGRELEKEQKGGKENMQNRFTIKDPKISLPGTVYPLPLILFHN